MLGTIAFILGSFALLIFQSYRSARERAADGEPFQPEGKLRWTADPTASRASEPG